MCRFVLCKCFVCAVVLTLLVACASKEKVVLPLETLYEQGTTAMQKKEYTKAVAAFKDIRDHYPFSPMIEEVALNLADAYYLSYKFIEAASAYEEFATLYPRNKVIPYVLYQMGASHEALFISVEVSAQTFLLLSL